MSCCSEEWSVCVLLPTCCLRILICSFCFRLSSAAIIAKRETRDRFTHWIVSVCVCVCAKLLCFFFCPCVLSAHICATGEKRQVFTLCIVCVCLCVCVCVVCVCV